MATKTSLLGLTKPAYTEAADIAVLNTNFDLIDKAVGNGARGANLLDDSWFVNPVNQRGAASYKGESDKNTYTIDRWFFSYDSAAELTVGNGYIQKNGHKLWQRLEGIDTSKTYTGAICLADGTVYAYSGTFTGGFGAWDKTLWCGVTSGYAYFRIETGMTEPVIWAALYEGEYTTDTLPAYVYKGYAAELAECMRYYQRSYVTTPMDGVSEAACIHTVALSSYSGGMYQFPVPMRRVPTLTIYSPKSGATDAICNFGTEEDASPVVTVKTPKGFQIRGSAIFESGKSYIYHYEASADL